MTVRERDKDAMLEIKVFMNSAVKEVLAFKTCCGFKVFDQNLEIHLKNLGDRPVIVPSSLELVGDHGMQRIENLMPSGNLAINPGEVKAFYCYMDEALWNGSRELVFRDLEGNRYAVAVNNG